MHACMISLGIVHIFIILCTQVQIYLNTFRMQDLYLSSVGHCGHQLLLICFCKFCRHLHATYEEVSIQMGHHGS